MSAIKLEKDKIQVLAVVDQVHLKERKRKRSTAIVKGVNHLQLKRQASWETILIGLEKRQQKYNKKIAIGQQFQGFE